MVADAMAFVFDFDDTLTPDSTTAFLQARGVDTNEFWSVKAKGLLKKGWDPVHAYLKLMFDLTKSGDCLEGLKNSDLRKFGNSLQLYAGLPEFFKDIRKLVKKADKDISVKFYVISSGLEEVIRGCKPISKELDGMYGCRLCGDTSKGPLKHIMRTVSFTDKTRYLFEINKGLTQSETDKNPTLVNKDIPQHARPIPFKRMVYVGDGLTDIPCFSLLKTQGGQCYAVLKTEDDEVGIAKRDLYLELLKKERVSSMNLPNYGPKAGLGMLLRTAAVNIVSEIQLARKQAYA